MKNLSVALVDDFLSEERVRLGCLTSILATEAEVRSLAEVRVAIQELLADGLTVLGVARLLETFGHIGRL